MTSVEGRKNLENKVIGGSDQARSPSEALELGEAQTPLKPLEGLEHPRFVGQKGSQVRFCGVEVQDGTIILHQLRPASEPNLGEHGARG